MKNITNIGILAHVDAGKTSLTENFLFLSGAIKFPGSVDQGSSVTDSMELEKERGISIRSASVSFTWKDLQINLIDTPGHTDFSAEVERALSVLDGVILLISAVEGVQAHTITLWEGIKKSGIPCMIFVNKIDRAGADFIQVISQINSELNIPVFPINLPSSEGGPDACPSSVFTTDILISEHKEIKENALEMMAEKDEEVLELFLNEAEVSQEIIYQKLKKLSKTREMLPLYCGSAKFGKGIEELLNGIMEFLPTASRNINTKLSALVFKLEYDKALGKLAHVRLFSGSLKNRDLIHNSSQNTEEKIAQIKQSHTGKLTDVQEICAGDIGIISGLQNIKAGDIIGEQGNIPPPTVLQNPVIIVSVKAIEEKDYAELASALSLLNTEDPSMNFKWYREEKEMQLSLMGTVQIEVLQAIIEKRFGIKTEFSDPTVIYKETPSGIAEAVVEYTMPKPCWAVMKFRVEPGERNSGIDYLSQVSVNKIHKKYQNEIEATVSHALEQGIKGWEVTDIKITLLDGEDHEIHSRPGDFILATPMGILRAIKAAGTKLLEPVYKFDISAPEEYLGTIVSDLTKMRGSFESPEFDYQNVRIRGILPVSTSLKYAIRLSSLTGGKGRIRVQFGGYQPCGDEHGQIREYKGVNPLDTSQWILHRRGAFKVNETKF